MHNSFVYQTRIIQSLWRRRRYRFSSYSFCDSESKVFFFYSTYFLYCNNFLLFFPFFKNYKDKHFFKVCDVTEWFRSDLTSSSEHLRQVRCWKLFFWIQESKFLQCVLLYCGVFIKLSFNTYMKNSEEYSEMLRGGWYRALARIKTHTLHSAPAPSEKIKFCIISSWTFQYICC